MSVRVFAPAKINLTLTVGRRREDGMHPLASAVAFADVGDWVDAAPSDTLSLRITGPFRDQLSQSDPENLVLRAARALAHAQGIEARIALTLEKNLPVASGIGGGSADAAAALRALNEAWSLGLDALELADLGRALGADVPVCVGSRPAYITGVGADWSPISAPALHAVLVNPRQQLATAGVYREFDRMGLGAAFAPASAPNWPTLSTALTDIAATGNALAAPAQALLSDIGVILEVLRSDARIAYAGLSGSGATCFALVDDARAAQAVAADLRVYHPHWWIAPTRLGGA